MVRALLLCLIGLPAAVLSFSSVTRSTPLNRLAVLRQTARVQPHRAAPSSAPRGLEVGGRTRGVLAASPESGDASGGFKLPFFLDPNTRGGALTLGFLLTLVPVIAYNFATAVLGFNEQTAGTFVSGVFVTGATLLWTFSYVFRVVNKDMTYAKQLQEYEDAVIQKRFEELQDDEVEALMGEIEREDKASAPPPMI